MNRTHYRKPSMLTLQNSTSAEILAEDLALSLPRFEDQLTALINSKAPAEMIENKMMVIDGLRKIYRDSALKNAQRRAQQK